MAPEASTTSTYEWPDRETWEEGLAGFRGLPSVSHLAADHCTPEEIANELGQLQHEIQKLTEEPSAIAQRLGMLEDRHRSLIWAGRRLLVEGVVPTMIAGWGRPDYLKRHPVLARYNAARVQAFRTRDAACLDTDDAWAAELDARARTEAWLAS